TNGTLNISLGINKKPNGTALWQIGVQNRQETTDSLVTPFSRQKFKEWKQDKENTSITCSHPNIPPLM
ncbi:6745_t:CDS:2, partial [Ambispora gerdemannii]